MFLKRVISAMLALLVVLSSCCTVYAAPKDSTLASYHESVISRYAELESFIAEGSSGQYGLLYEMRVLEEYSMYVIHTKKYSGTGSDCFFTESEQEYYESELKKLFKNFNARYGKDSSEYLSITLKNSGSDVVSNAQHNLVSKDKIPGYLTTLLEKVQKKYDDVKTTAEKQKVLTENATLLSNVYSCLAVYQNVPNTLTNLSPEKGGKHPKFSIDGSLGNSTVNKLIQDIASKYKELLTYGKKIAENEGDTGSLEVDLDAQYVEILSNAVVGKNGIEIPEEAQLDLPYLAMLACSSAYTPLESYAGSEEFTTALKALATDEENAEDLTEVYNSIKNFRKPLYKRSVDSNGDPTGVASIITIQDFFDSIEKGSNGSLCLIDGDFHYNTDAQSWVYNHINVNTKLADGATVFNSDTAGDTDESSVLDSELDTEVATASGESIIDNTDSSIKPSTSTGSNASNKSLTDSQKQALASAAKDTVGTRVKNTTSTVRKLITNSPLWKTVVNGSIKRGKEILNSIASMFATIGVGKNSYAAVTDYNSTVKSWRNVIFVGDSRTVGLATACIAAVGESGSGCSRANEVFKDQNLHFFGVTGGGYSAFEKAVSDVTKLVKEGSYTVVFNYGVNDLGNISKYVEKLNSLATGDWKDAKVIAESVGAVDEATESSHGYSVKNADILSFNNKLKTGLNSGITYIDVTTKMLDSGQKGLASGYNSSDGVHYDSESYLKLVSSILSNVQDTDDNTDQTELTSAAETSEEEETDDETIEEDITKAVYAYKEITDESKMSEAVLLYGTKYVRQYDNMTTVIMQNILNNSVAITKIKDKNTRYLYMNALGDIVTDDNLVILPGICNPLLVKDGFKYNPYTVAFMNSYPSVLSTSINFQVTANSDIGKYVILADTKTADVEGAIFDAYLITDNKNVKTSNYLEVLPLNTDFFVNTTDKVNILVPQRLIFGNQSKWLDSPLYDSSPIVVGKTATINERALFPYIVEEDTTYIKAVAIANNAFQQMTLDTELNATKNLGHLNDNYILHNIIIYNLGGTNNPQGYSKNELLEYDNFVEGSSNRVNKLITNLSTSILEKTSDVDSVIGLKTSYEDPILGKVFTTVRNNWILFLFVIALILLIAFMKMKRDLLETIVLMTVSCGFVYLFVYIAPVYLPMFYNVVINNTCENLTYEILAAKTEEQDADDNLISSLDGEGNYALNTSSLTLYRVGFNDLKDFYESSGVKAADVTGGGTEMLDQEAGEFIEGDSIKVNTDLLMKNLFVSGEYSTNAMGNNVYHLKADKTVSSNIDYYTPYYQFADNFIEKLNALADVYAIPRSTTVYSDGKSKNNYLVYSYVNSKPFLTPGSYKDVQVIEDNIIIDESAVYQSTDVDLAERLEAAFGSNADWLGISNTLWDISDKSKQTLWAKTLQENGYYDANWVPNNEKMNKLILYVNKQTKDFIFDMEDQIGELSDSTMIKVIALRALVAFTQESSEYGNWLYPFSLNYAELSLGDVLLSVFTDNYEEFIAMDSNVVEYLGNEHGWFHLIMFDLLVILMFLLVNVTKVLVPVMYILLGSMLLIKLVLRGDLKTTLMGYIKCSCLVFAGFTVFDIAICITKKLSGSAIAIYLLLFITILVLYCLFLILSSVLTNITDLGNEKIGVQIRGVSDRGLLNNMLNNININVANLRKGNEKRRRNREITREDVGYSRLDAYSSDAPIDSFYGSSRRRYTTYKTDRW